MVGISEIDVDAIIAYGVIHLEGTYDNFTYPLKEEMQQWLLDRNIGYDFKKKKSRIPRLKKDKIQKLFQACINTNNYGDISLIKPNELPNFDLFNFSFPCFIAGTLVLTNKGYKNIEDIKEGDMVLTHTNTYQKVVKPMINKANSIYRLKTMCSEDLLVTEEHPFYVRKKKRINTRIKGKAVNYREFSNPQWVKIKDLSKDYYVGIAINQESKLPNWNGVEVNSTWVKYGNKKLLNTIKKYFNNNDFWWIVGRYMGDGWVKNIIDHKGTDIYDLYICCAKDEIHEITDVLDNLNLINNDFKYKYYEDRTVYKIRISNVEFAKFLQQFGKGAKNKKLNNTIIDLPKNLLKSFLDGYISADGYFTKNIYKCSSISNKLIYGIGQCVAKVHNAPFSIYKTIRSKTCVIEGRIVNQNDVYDIAWKIEKKKQDKAFYEDGYIWCPINGLEKEQYNGLVYNMEVENDNSYTANNIIVHNCTDISVAGKQKGMKDEQGNLTRSGLYTYGINIIRTKKPKYIMIENVKNLIGKKFINDFYDIVNELNDIGYNCYYPKNNKDKPMCLNAKDYGVPQNRERIFVICIRKDIDNKQFQFPNGFDNGIRLKDLLEDKVDEKYYISSDKTNKLLSELKAKEVGINPCLTPDRLIKRQNGRRFKEDGEPSFTINTQDRNGILINHSKIQFKDDNISSCLDANYYKGLDNHAARTGILETGVYNQKDGFKQRDIGCTLDASYYKGLGNNQNRNAVLEFNHIDVIGRLEMKGQDNIRRVYNPKGISPALTTMEGGNREPKILEVKEKNTEEWKDIKNYEGMYQISNFGRIKSLNRIIKTGINNGYRELQETIKVPRMDKYGYLKVQLSKENITEDKTVHRLVAEAFIPNPKNKPEINHKDGIKTNNYIDNLEWVTTLENQLHRKNVLHKQGSKPNIPKGASWNTEKGRWVSYIKIDNKTKFLGYCNSKEEAHKLYFYEFVKAYNYEPWDVNEFPDESILIIRNRQPKVIENNELQFVGGIGDKDWVGDNKKLSRNYPQGNRVYNSKNIAVSQTAQGGGIGSYSGLYKVEENINQEKSPVPELVGGIGEINFGKQYRQGNRVYSSEKTAMCLMSQPVGNTGGFSYLYNVDYRIRKLTPKECWRLMNFDDEDIDKCINIGISNTQLYKMSGNSIVVNVLYYIFKNLFNV